MLAKNIFKYCYECSLHPLKKLFGTYKKIIFLTAFQTLVCLFCYTLYTGVDKVQLPMQKVAGNNFTHSVQTSGILGIFLLENT